LELPDQVLKPTGSTPSFTMGTVDKKYSIRFVLRKIGAKQRGGQSWWNYQIGQVVLAGWFHPDTLQGTNDPFLQAEFHPPPLVTGAPPHMMVVVK
jgi:hypothetical protein